ERLGTGQFHVADLYGFWLPFFQMAAALLNLAIGNPLLAGKILSALCGATSCILVFAVTRMLTGNVRFALLALALLLVNPLHILFSAAAMTDVPFGCLVLASLCFALQDRWAAAAIFAALAGAVRIEGWALIPLLSVIQFWRERKISLVVCVVPALPVVGWLLTSYAATGNFFAYFAERASYQSRYLDFHPTRRGFALPDIHQDVTYFLIGANELVFAVALVALGFLLVQALQGSLKSAARPAVLTGYLFSILALIVVAYVTKRQPVILPRYSLFFLVLGLPLCVWMLQLFTEKFRPVRLVQVVALVVVAVFLQL